MPKALVTGASGFIGSTLVDLLSRKGYEVHALLRSTSDVSNLSGMNYQRVEGDLSNVESLKKAVAGMDYVFHLAGAVTAPSRDGYFAHNANGTRNLIEAVAATNSSMRRFVHVSSLAAAGPAPSLESPRLESQAETPVSAYGESKLQGEKEVLKHAGKIPVVVIRPPMVYGPKDKGVFVLIRTVARKMMPLVRGGTRDGSKYYSLIHVSDLCAGIVQAAEAPSLKSGEIFYLSDGGVYTHRELLLSMARSLGVRPLEFPIFFFFISAAAGVSTALGKATGKSFALNWDKLNEIRPDFWICSTEKAKAELGYAPRFNLATGMADAIGWYRENKWL